MNVIGIRSFHTNYDTRCTDSRQLIGKNGPRKQLSNSVRNVNNPTPTIPPWICPLFCLSPLKEKTWFLWAAFWKAHISSDHAKCVFCCSHLHLSISRVNKKVDLILFLWQIKFTLGHNWENTAITSIPENQSWIFH